MTDKKRTLERIARARWLIGNNALALPDHVWIEVLGCLSDVEAAVKAEEKASAP